ncbi:trans-aconitate 2-methyltransferase [Psychromicrobium sp. YIM B11713]|uniref:trans-aconitate 2-methyltransferase n=1 Tax=Psychromicrobium sp. YIM B11713 TaxID=3145233 RepID=UPI00374FC507
MSFTWDPTKYVQFGDFRDRPFFDMTARVLTSNPAEVVDLGCGPGNLTETLAVRWPGAQVRGLDSSAEMVAAANEKTQQANLSFELGDIASWMPSETVDVVVTNAALQWVPGHRELLANWLQALKPGAWFAMQVPGNFGADSHRLMRELAESPAWREKLGGVLRHTDVVGEPQDYLDIFSKAGMRADGWETTYQQILQGESPVLNWVRGTALRPVANVLSEQDIEKFESEYAPQLELAYPKRDYGTVFPFRRIFVVGQKL